MVSQMAEFPIYTRTGIMRKAELNKVDLKVPIPEGHLDEEPKDECPVCSTDLFIDLSHTSRIALVEDRFITGWICPECYSEFDRDDNLVVIMAKNSSQGVA